MSNPGFDSPVCGDTLRAWCQADTDSVLLDVKKAYLQVRVDPSLAHYQVVMVNGVKYVMTRMGFGLSIAPKVMDAIIKYVTRGCADVDNYVDDLRVPSAQVNHEVAQMSHFGLETKPAEQLSTARVLGLQLYREDDKLYWDRCDDVQLHVADNVTRREVFKWCGRIVGHYPVCSLLRVACSYLKRLATADNDDWDKPVSGDVVMCCVELESMLEQHDPVYGEWSVDVKHQPCRVWCDASDTAIGVMLESGDSTMEDRSWLRPKDDKRHVNLAELKAAVEGLKLAVDYGIKEVTLISDLKTVHAWLSARLRNTQRVKVHGLNDVVV